MAPKVHFEINPTVIKVAAAVAIGGIALYGVEELSHQDGLPQHDVCTDVSHELVEVGDTSHVLGLSKDFVRDTFGADDNRTWTDVAAKVSKDRGYTISEERLMQANPRLVINHKTGPSETIGAKGPTCIDLPGPIVWGLTEADGKESTADIALNNTTTAAKVIDKNPGLSDNPNAVPKKGTVIEVGLPQVDNLTDPQEPFDASLVLGPLESPTINQAYHGDAKERNKVILANADKLGAGQSITAGDEAFVPYEQTSYMKKHSITTAAIIDTYRKNYVQPNVEQNIQPNPNVATVKVDYELNAQQLSMIDALNVSKSDKQFMKEVLPVIMSKVAGGDRMNPAAVMAIAIDESGWGSSQIARSGYNLFGVKAMSDWNGPTMNANGSEQHTDGSYESGDYTWRKYKNYAESIDDFALFIGDGTHPWFADAMSCDQTARQFVRAMEFKLDKQTCELIGKAVPGDKEPAHATSLSYVPTIMNIVRDTNLQAIIDVQPVKIPALK